MNKAEKYLKERECSSDYNYGGNAIAEVTYLKKDTQKALQIQKQEFLDLIDETIGTLSDFEDKDYRDAVTDLLEELKSKIKSLGGNKK